MRQNQPSTPSLSDAEESGPLIHKAGPAGIGAQRVSLAAAFCSAIALAGMMILMLIDVAGRYWFNSPVPGAGELIEQAMGITVFAALPMVTARNEHIQLDYFSNAMRGRVRQIVNALIQLSSAAIMGLIAWRLVVKALSVIHYGDTTPFLRWPIAPTAVLIAACAVLAALIFALAALRLFGQVLLGKPTEPSNKVG